MKKDLRKKYFGIGFNKTATTTLYNLFKYNKIPSWHDVESYWNTDKYCAFFDSRHSVGCPIYGVSVNSEISIPSIKKYIEYPNSIFILHTRPLDDWLISRFKHGQSWAMKRNQQTNWAHPPSNELAKTWISARQIHHMNILEFFKDMPEKLIIVDISRQNWQSWLCKHLKLKIGPTEIKSNVRSLKKTDAEIADCIRITIRTTFEELGYDQDQQRQNLVNTKDIKDLIKNYQNNL